MRVIAIIFLIPVLFVACVKQNTKDPVPVLEYRSVNRLERLPAGGGLPARDTAVLVLGYQDGDGDLFRNSTSNGANLVYTTYAFNQDSNKFIVDGYSNSQTLLQPANGYYKGKSIQGEIYIPMAPFRSGDNIKIVKFEAFMVDMKDHKSNVVTSPVFTLNF